MLKGKTIGRIRRFFFMPFPCRWNAWIRDLTAKLG